MEYKDGKFIVFLKEKDGKKYYSGKGEYKGEPLMCFVNKKGVAKDGTPMLEVNVRPRQQQNFKQDAQVSNEADFNPIKEAWENA